MARKTTKIAQALIDKHNRQREMVEKKIAQVGIFDAFEDIAKLTGMEIMLTEALNHQNCYHGFNIVDSDGNPTTEEQPPWRVSYIIR